MSFMATHDRLPPKGRRAAGHVTPFRFRTQVIISTKRYRIETWLQRNTNRKLGTHIT